MKKCLSIILAVVLAFGAAAPALAAGGLSGEELVTDAFTLDYGDEWGSYGFSVPKINRDDPGIQEVNEAIWKEFYDGILNTEYGPLTAIDEGWSAEPYSMEYRWAVNGDVLSLWVWCSYSGDYDVYSVYNVSLSAGRRISDSELLSVLGVEEDAFYAQVTAELSDQFEQLNGMFPTEDDFMREQLDQARANTSGEANVHAVRPYLTEDGELYAIAKLYTLAGGGELNFPMPVLGRDQLPAEIVSAGLPEQAPLDGRLTWFLDGCTSQVFTRADIEGFDEQTCLYARNGVYARSGRMFNDPDLQAFFSRFSWYYPYVEPADFTSDMLNDCQIQNIALVMAYESEHGY